MADRLDNVARMLAAEERVTRRKALRGVATLLGGGMFGALAGRSPAGAQAAKPAPAVQCQPGTTRCGTVCRDTSINPDHCGGCDVVCPAGQMCRNGACVPCICEAACPAGQTRCGGVCVDTQTSSSHCGACGTACPPGQSCGNGVCSQCPGSMCNGGCVNFATDVNNCGSCGNVCQAPNATMACVGGQCEIATCLPGFADCDPNVAGCETDLRSTFNCGACGVVCPAGAVCVNGNCVCPFGTQVCGSTCANLGQGCNTGLPGICATGRIQCVNGNAVCVQDNQPRPEVCNGLDDNCNGIVDEGNPGGGLACNTGLPGACAAGVTNCVNGTIVCTAPAGC